MKHTRTFPPCGPARRVASGFLAASMAVTLGLSSAVLAPSIAWGETSDELSSQLETAQAELDDLTHQLEIAQASVEETEYQLSETRAQIAELEDQIASTTEKLSTAQQALSVSASSSYKNGGSLSLVELVLSSSSFDELTSNIYYASKVVDAESEQVSLVKQLKGDLESQQGELAEQEASQQALLEEQTASEQRLSSAQAEAQSYVDGLSSELQAALEAERQAQAEEARRQAEAAAAQQAQEQQQQQQQQQAQQSQQQTGTSAPSGSTGGSAAVDTPPASSSSGGLSSSQRSTISSAAQSQLGVSYSLGASSPGVAMDCSGLTSYAYAQAGISIPHQSGAQYRMVVNAGNLKTSASSLEVGDLVFYASGGSIYHVAIYIGGGMVCHANGYGSGVVNTSVFLDSGFCGGGSPV